MRRARRGQEETTRTISTLRRLIGRPSRPSRGRRTVALVLLRILLVMPFMLVVGTVAAWWLGAMIPALTGPGNTFQFERFSLTLPRGQELTIGRAHLMQPAGYGSAEIEHIRVMHTPAGEVRIANVAKQRRLGVLRNQQSTGAGSSDRIELTGPADQTTRIVIDGRDVIFSKVSGAGFEAEITGVGRFQATIGLGWNRLRAIGADGTPGDDLPVCAKRGWRDLVQANIAWLAVLFDRALDQPVVHLGGDRSCQIGPAFQLALPRPDGIDELVVSMVTEDRWGTARRLFVAPASRQIRNLVTVEHYPAGCAVKDARCRTVSQSGFAGTSWLVARENAPPTPELKVWRFVAGRTTYAMAVAPLGTLERGLFPAMRISFTPLTNLQQFSRADCAWFLTAGAQPPARDPDDEDAPVCPERPRSVDPAFQIEVKPTQANLMFDRQMAARPLEGLERVSRLALLLAAVAIALLLAVPATGTSKKWPWLTAGIYRIARIWPVLLSVAIAAIPDILLSLDMRIPATTAFAITIANWTFAGCVLALVPRTGRQLALMWAVLMGLAAIGSVSLATFAGDIGTTRAAAALVKHKLVFLDLLPPLTLAIVTARQETLRPLLASIVLDNRKRFAAVRWLPPLALIALFLVWLTVGTQQGLGSLQPVEGGKFWFVVIVGTILVSLERGSRAEVLTSTRWSRAAAVFIVVIFMIALFLVPLLRNDYSPILIISATGLVLVLVRFLPDVWRWIVARFRMLSERMHLPMRMRPPVYEPLIPPLRRPRVRRGTKFLAGIGVSLSGLVIVMLAVVFFGGAIFAVLLSLERTEWPTERAEQISLLERSLGIGRRVPIERVLTWIDLSYRAADTPESRPRASYRDIGFQVIRSRVEIENAECKMSDEMRGQAVLPGLGTLPNRAIERVALGAAWLFGFDLAPDSPLCLRRVTTEMTDTATASTILDARGAHTIPVAENDFAAAYLIARHGVESAVLLFAFQFAFFVLAVVAYVRLIRVEGGDTSDLIVRYLLSILLAATAALFVIQWFLSWSNSLGLFPVMGQPMTWLSAGSSHHLLMALPCAITVLLAVRYTLAIPVKRSLRAPPL
jgi:cell division protein FtsW (lipid II flippase)